VTATVAPLVGECSDDECDLSTHPDWTHAETWQQIRDALDNGVGVLDSDGDSVVVLTNDGEYRYVSPGVTLDDEDNSAGNDDSNVGHFRINKKPVEPVTEEELQATLRSIMGGADV
jgi:hypothetical protein